MGCVKVRDAARAGDPTAVAIRDFEAAVRHATVVEVAAVLGTRSSDDVREALLEVENLGSALLERTQGVVVLS